MKKNLILMTALFAGTMLINDGFALRRKTVVTNTHDKAPANPPQEQEQPAPVTNAVNPPQAQSNVTHAAPAPVTNADPISETNYDGKFVTDAIDFLPATESEDPDYNLQEDDRPRENDMPREDQLVELVKKTCCDIVIPSENNKEQIKTRQIVRGDTLQDDVILSVQNVIFNDEFYPIFKKYPKHKQEQLIKSFAHTFNNFFNNKNLPCDSNNDILIDNIPAKDINKILCFIRDNYVYKIIDISKKCRNFGYHEKQIIEIFEKFSNEFGTFTANFSRDMSDFERIEKDLMNNLISLNPDWDSNKFSDKHYTYKLIFQNTEIRNLVDDMFNITDFRQIYNNIRKNRIAQNQLYHQNQPTLENSNTVSEMPSNEDIAAAFSTQDPDTDIITYKIKDKRYNDCTLREAAIILILGLNVVDVNVNNVNYADTVQEVQDYLLGALNCNLDNVSEYYKNKYIQQNNVQNPLESIDIGIIKKHLEQALSKLSNDNALNSYSKLMKFYKKFDNRLLREYATAPSKVTKSKRSK